MHHFIASKDFRKATLNALAKKKIFVIGVQAFKETYDNGAWGSGVAYTLDNNDQGQVRSHAEVIALALFNGDAVANTLASC